MTTAPLGCSLRCRRCVLIDVHGLFAQMQREDGKKARGNSVFRPRHLTVPFPWTMARVRRERRQTSSRNEFRSIHTADIHLDSPLRSLALRNSEVAELVGDASRQAFAAIVDLCLAARVDALVGDLYDGDQTSIVPDLIHQGDKIYKARLQDVRPPCPGTVTNLQNSRPATICIFGLGYIIVATD